MKNKILIALTLISTLAFADHHKDHKMDPKMAKMMEKMKEYSTPGDAHKVLAQAEGKWNYTSKFWMDPHQKPEESKGKSEFKMLFGGRYLQQMFKGTAHGQPFEGMGITGYDNLQKKYKTVWFDSMGTGMMMSEGSYNKDTKTLSDEGEHTCPMGKDNKAKFRSEWKMIDAKNMVFSMYGKGMDDSQDEFKMMEITYKK